MTRQEMQEFRDEMRETLRRMEEAKPRFAVLHKRVSANLEERTLLVKKLTTAALAGDERAVKLLTKKLKESTDEGVRLAKKMEALHERVFESRPATT